MQEAFWIALFRRIPVNLHDSLALVLATGTEVVVQQIIKLEPDLVILRGRVAGTQDSGRVVLLPYNQLVLLALTRRMTDQEVEAIFGKDGQAFAADVALPASTAADTPAEPAEEAAEPPAAKGPAKEGNSPAKPALPSKAELLAKLRSRLNDTARPGG